MHIHLSDFKSEWKHNILLIFAIVSIFFCYYNQNNTIHQFTSYPITTSASDINVSHDEHPLQDAVHITTLSELKTDTNSNTADNQYILLTTEFNFSNKQVIKPYLKHNLVCRFKVRDKNNNLITMETEPVSSDLNSVIIRKIIDKKYAHQLLILTTEIKDQTDYRYLYSNRYIGYLKLKSDKGNSNRKNNKKTFVSDVNSDKNNKKNILKQVEDVLLSDLLKHPLEAGSIVLLLILISVGIIIGIKEKNS